MKPLKIIRFSVFLFILIVCNNFSAYCDEGTVDAFEASSNAAMQHAAQQFINEGLVLKELAGGASNPNSGKFATEVMKVPMTESYPSSVGFFEWGKNKINTSAIRLYCDEIGYIFSYTNFKDCASVDDLWVKVKVHNNIKHANWTCVETIMKHTVKDTERSSANSSSSTHTETGPTYQYKTKTQTCKQNAFEPKNKFYFGRAFSDLSGFSDGTSNYFLGANSCGGIYMTNHGPLYTNTNTGSDLSAGLFWTPTKRASAFAEAMGEDSLLQTILTDPQVTAFAGQSDFNQFFYISGQLGEGKDNLQNVKEIKAYGPDVEAAIIEQDSEVTSGEDIEDFEEDTTTLTEEDFGKVSPQEWWEDFKNRHNDGEIDGPIELYLVLQSNIDDYFENDEAKDWNSLSNSQQNKLTAAYEDIWKNSDDYQTYQEYLQGESDEED